VRVADINPGPGGSWPTNLTAVGPKVFFDADDGASGEELWSSDGTLEGTARVKDIAPGPDGSFPDELLNVGDAAYFAAEQSGDHVALWRSDGTAAGTLPFADVAPGMPEASLGEILQSGATLYFTADDVVHGSELWRVSSGPTIVSIDVAGGTAQRSQVKDVTITFDRIVSLASGAARLELLNTGGSGADDGSPPTDISTTLAAPTTPDGGRTWRFTFAGASPFVQKTPRGVPTGSLVDGIYRITLDPAKVTAGGVAMDSSAGLTFHRLFGDINGSKVVNAADYNLFRPAFGRVSADPAYNAAFDFDGNGAVNAADYNQFRSRFGKGLAYA
jgi:ELWxxDGT repeat protein